MDHPLWQKLLPDTENEGIWDLPLEVPCLKLITCDPSPRGLSKGKIIPLPRKAALGLDPGPQGCWGFCSSQKESTKSQEASPSPVPCTPHVMLPHIHLSYRLLLTLPSESLRNPQHNSYFTHQARENKLPKKALELQTEFINKLAQKEEPLDHESC